MKKAIVTGANGFIGSSVCQALSEDGIEVIAIIKDRNEEIGQIEKLKNIRIIYCEFENFGSLDALIADKDIDILYHFAWVGSSGALRGDADTQIKNIQYTLNTIKACYKMNCSRFAFAASIMEYEVQKSMSTEEKQAINSLYSIAKLTCDYMGRVLAEQFKIDYMRCIISNVYGPGEKSPRLINSSLRKMLNGEHCAFSSGEQMYDFIYITDAAKAFREIGKNGIAERTYYIGSLNPKPLKEFLLEMRDAVDPHTEIGLGELLFNGISLKYDEFDLNAVKRDTGFVPEISFSVGIKNTLNWLKEEEI